MILKKHLLDDSGSSSSATILGLKVVGGKILDSGRLGAVIEKVKKGSIADTIGRLRPGDEVVEWNGRSVRKPLQIHHQHAHPAPTFVSCRFRPLLDKTYNDV